MKVIFKYKKTLFSAALLFLSNSDAKSELCISNHENGTDCEVVCLDGRQNHWSTISPEMCIRIAADFCGTTGRSTDSESAVLNADQSVTNGHLSEIDTFTHELNF